MEKLDKQLIDLGIVTSSYYNIDFDEYVEHLRNIKLGVTLYIDHTNKIIRNKKAMTNYFNCVINYGSIEGYIAFNQIEVL